jgi:hypothetical protein
MYLSAMNFYFSRSIVEEAFIVISQAINQFIIGMTFDMTHFAIIDMIQYGLLFTIDNSVGNSGIIQVGLKTN